MADITYTKTTWANSPSTTTPISASNLQNIEDVLNKVVHKSSRGTSILQADEVPDFGIGAIKDLGAVNLNSVLVNGFYKVVGGTNGPGGTCYGTLIVNTYAASAGAEYSHQVFIQTGSSTSTKTIYMRRCEGGTWDTWAQMWGSNNDGNAGQPPAPKPLYGSTAIGAWYDSASSSLPATGTFAVISFKSGAYYKAVAGVAGGSDMNTFFGTTGITTLAYWRTA